jgi:hypothetical protein
VPYVSSSELITTIVHVLPYKQASNAWAGSQAPMWNTAQERCDLHFKCEHNGCNTSCTFGIYPGWLASVSLAQRLHVFAETSSASEWDAYPAVWWEEGRAVDTGVTLMYTNTATYTFQGSKHVFQLPTAIRSPSRECPTLDAVAASLGLFSPVWHMTACSNSGGFRVQAMPALHLFMACKALQESQWVAGRHVHHAITMHFSILCMQSVHQAA